MAEVKWLLRLGFPIVATCLLQSFVLMVSIMVVGHFGEVQLAGAALASSLATVTGYSVLVCFASIVIICCVRNLLDDEFLASYLCGWVVFV